MVPALNKYRNEVNEANLRIGMKLPTHDSFKRILFQNIIYFAV